MGSGIQLGSCTCVCFLCSVAVWFQTLVSCQVNNDHVVHFGDVMVIKSGKGGAPSKAHVRGSILSTRQLDQLGSVISTEM